MRSAGGYGGVGVVENSVGSPCVVVAGRVGVSPSLCAFVFVVLDLRACLRDSPFIRILSFSGPRLRRAIHIHTYTSSRMLTYILAFALLLLRLLLRLLSLRSCAWRRVRACASSSLVSLPSSLRLSGVAFTRRPLLRRGCEPIPVPLRVSPASRSRAPPTRSAVAVHPRLCFFTLRRRRAAVTTPRWPCLLCRTDEC